MHVLYAHVHEMLIDASRFILERDSNSKETLVKQKPQDIISFYSKDLFNYLSSIIKSLSSSLKGNILYQIIGV